MVARHRHHVRPARHLSLQIVEFGKLHGQLDLTAENPRKRTIASKNLLLNLRDGLIQIERAKSRIHTSPSNR